ncbi:MAG TPA: formate dehydrogenase accessory sulfurtransferase FdhD [Bacteroidia bacterium]|nr:formate dehydrogenase accessory sulfurtransferase FdhD [Bacteroidia bacterium]HRD39855.1 formate dehydrogenase accessory sulfurtransferase FdhD [Bacteroidia bacterium]
MEIKLYSGICFNENKFSETSDFISIEVPLSIAVNNIPFTVTMQTPGNEADLARGLLFTENIFKSQECSPLIEVISKNGEGYIESINVQIPSKFILKDFAGTRNVISASSCGVCGKTTLDDTHCETVNNSDKLQAELVPEMFRLINEGQKHFRKSGGTHAAGAFTINGKLLVLHEDIGRHNAVDKVIGFLIHNRLMEKAKCITVSGRLSYEIVEKAKSANIPFIAAVSAPSTLAIDNAQESGITLMAFCRNDKFTVYSNPHQILINTNVPVK